MPVRPCASPIARWSWSTRVKGVEVQTEKTWAYANEFIVPRMMVITKLDKEHADFGTALESAQNSFSRAIIPFTLPIGREKDFRGVVDVVHLKAYELAPTAKRKRSRLPAEDRELVDKTRERLIELVAESDDALMEKYFEQGTLEEADIICQTSIKRSPTASSVRSSPFPA